MFMSNRNNNGNGISVNTSLYRSCSDTAMLQVGGWNDKLSVKFSPCTGVNEDGLRQYNQDSNAQIITSLTVDNAFALLEGLKKYINPAIDDDKIKEASVTVAIGAGDKRKALTIAYKDDVITATIIVGVGDDGKVVENSSSLTHTFNTRKIMKNYNAETGEGVEEVVQADYLNFYKRIEDINVIQQASYHTYKHGSAISNTYRSNNSGNYNNQTYQAPVEHSTGSISDFLADMGS